MEEKAKSTLEPPEEKTFLERFAPAIAILVVLAIIAASIIGTMLVLKRQAEAQRVAPAVIAAEDLPGPKNQLSERSKYQLVTMAKQYSHILAVAVVASNYRKDENLYIFTWTENPKVRTVLDEIVGGIEERQRGPNGVSSKDIQRQAMRDPNMAARLLRNSEEARLGLIKCVPLSDATLINESLRTIATGICYATIPPFESKSSMAIVMLTDSKLTELSELAEMRRILLALQIDIYNRDFKGRETWAHP